MGAATTATTASAVLRVSDLEIPGVLVRADDWSFSPMVPLDRRERSLLTGSTEMTVMWGERAQRHEMSVEVGPITAEEIALRPVGEERRVQRRQAVRAPMMLSCRLLSADSTQVTMRSCETIDISATGAALLLHTTAETAAGVPRVDTSVGLVLDLEELTLAVVARVMGSHQTEAGRTVLRLRFDQIRRRDSDEIHRQILKSERERRT